MNPSRFLGQKFVGRKGLGDTFSPECMHLKIKLFSSTHIPCHFLLCKLVTNIQGFYFVKISMIIFVTKPKHELISFALWLDSLRRESHGCSRPEEVLCWCARSEWNKWRSFLTWRRRWRRWRWRCCWSNNSFRHCGTIGRGAELGIINWLCHKLNGWPIFGILRPASFDQSNDFGIPTRRDKWSFPFLHKRVYDLFVLAKFLKRQNLLRRVTKQEERKSKYQIWLNIWVCWGWPLALWMLDLQQQQKQMGCHLFQKKEEFQILSTSHKDGWDHRMKSELIPQDWCLYEYNHIDGGKKSHWRHQKRPWGSISWSRVAFSSSLKHYHSIRTPHLWKIEKYKCSSDEKNILQNLF